MKNISEWKPTKIENKGDQFYVNRFGVGAGSLYMTLEDFRVTNLFKSYLKGHLVDLGCGNVPYYRWYKDQVEHITCVDWSQSRHNEKFIDVFANLSQSLPLESESVDCVFSTSVLEHINEPLILLKEIKRVLRQDGYLILSVPFLYNLHEEPADYYRYTPYCLEHLANSVELELLSLQHYGSGFGVLIDVSSKIVEALIELICKFVPKYVSWVMRKIGYYLLRLYQQSFFWILKQEPILQLIDRANLSSRFALGYVAVFKVKDLANNH